MSASETNFFRDLALLVFLSTLQACGTLTSGSVLSADESAQSISFEHSINGAREQTGEEEFSSPLKISISDSYIDEKDRLNVKAVLEAKVNFETEEIVLILQGIKEGEVVEEKLSQLAELTPFETLRAKQKLAILLKLDSSDFSEYQLRLSWGEDASKQIAARKQSELENQQEEETGVSIKRAMLSDNKEDQEEFASFLKLSTKVGVQELECAESPCKILYTLNSELINISEESEISDIVLALGIIWQKKGTEPKYPANLEALKKGEEKVALEGFSLLPAEGKVLKIAVDRPIPTSEKGQFLPYLRIVSFKKASF